MESRLNLVAFPLVAKSLKHLNFGEQGDPRLDIAIAGPVGAADRQSADRGRPATPRRAAPALRISAGSRPD